MKSVSENEIFLKGEAFYLTKHPADVYRVAKGSVYVYLVPMEGETPGRRAFLCEVLESALIPSFSYQDQENKSWCFCLTAKEEAVLTRMPGMNTSPLKKKFLQRFHVKDTEENSYEGTLVNHYRLTLVSEDAYLIKTVREKGKNKERTNRLLTSAFGKHSYKNQEKKEKYSFLRDTDCRKMMSNCFQEEKAFDFMLIWFLSLLLSLTGALVPVLIQRLYDMWLPLGSAEKLFQAGCFVLLLFAGEIFGFVLRQRKISSMKRNILCRMRKEAFEKVFKLPESFFRKQESTELVGSLLETEAFLQEAFSMIFSLPVHAVSLLLFSCLLCYYNRNQSAVVFVFLIFFFVFQYIMQCHGITYQKEIRAEEEKKDSDLYQFLQGIEKIRMQGAENLAVYQCLKNYAEQREKEAAFVRLSDTKDLIQKFGWFFMAAVLCLLSAPSAGMTMGATAAFGIATFLSVRTTELLAKEAAGGERFKDSCKRIRIFFEIRGDLQKKQMPLDDFSGRIDFSHVEFSYEGEEELVFSDLNLHIKEGEYIGIAGTSGCGKSTLFRLLMGFELPSAGYICYDGYDGKNLDLKKLRQKFGVVLQDGALISGSIYENITLNAEKASYEEVQGAIEAVGLTRDLKEMPMGWGTIVSENCSTISGGQKQRILIARALLGHPKLILFDEATSALDNVTQAIVSKTLEQMKCTRIVIAHRLSTIQNCSRILVLDKGRILEEGTYGELMERKGLFYSLAKRQQIV